MPNDNRPGDGAENLAKILEELSAQFPPGSLREVPAKPRPPEPEDEAADLKREEEWAQRHLAEMAQRAARVSATRAESVQPTNALAPAVSEPPSPPDPEPIRTDEPTQTHEQSIPIAPIPTLAREIPMGLIRFIISGVFLAAVVLELWTYSFPRNALLALNEGIANPVISAFLPPKDDPIAYAATLLSVKYGLLVIEVLAAIAILWWLLRILFGNTMSIARWTVRQMWGHALGVTVFVGTVWYAAYSYHILWGDVSIRGLVLWPAWMPKDTYPWMTAQIGYVTGFYIVINMAPAVFRQVLGILPALLNVFGSALTGGIWLSAAVAMAISTEYTVTPFRIHAIKEFAPVFVSDLFIIVILFRLMRRMAVATTEEVSAGAARAL